MTTWPILSVVTFLPAVGALLVYFLARGNDEAANRNARWIALWTTVVTFAVSLILVMRFDPAQPDFQFVEIPFGIMKRRIFRSGKSSIFCWLI